MKIKYLILLLIFGSVTLSCEKWLDVQSEDTILKNALFRNGYGYRVALNGVFKKLGEPRLYGQHMLWGGTDVMGHLYKHSEVHGIGISRNDVYNELYNFDYEADNVKSLYTGIWSALYNNIANCNVIIESIAYEPNIKFEEGEVEKNTILGEALALRGFMHFELLRYFAPAIIKGNKDTWMPYITEFPITSAAENSSEEVMELVIKDLLKAKDLVAQRDTLSPERVSRLRSDLRFSPINADMFFASRGYRMNYGAICGILARAYNYMGEYKKSYEIAKSFLEFNKRNGQLWYFTQNHDMDNHRKLTNDIIFTVSNKDTFDNYDIYTNLKEDYTMSSSGLFLVDQDDLYDDKGDYRLTKLRKFQENRYSNISLKYILPTLPNIHSDNTVDILPIIRLSEIWYIVAEAVALGGVDAEINNESFTGLSGAAKAIEKVKRGRYNTIPSIFSTIDGFKEELIKETRREFFGEGQVFHYYKKLDVDIIPNMPDDGYYFPKVTV